MDPLTEIRRAARRDLLSWGVSALLCAVSALILGFWGGLLDMPGLDTVDGAIIGALIGAGLSPLLAPGPSHCGAPDSLRH